MRRPATVLVSVAEIRRAGGGALLHDLALFGQQRLAVADRDLVIIGMDFTEGQEPVAIAAVVDERRLQKTARHERSWPDRYCPSVVFWWKFRRQNRQDASQS